MMNDKVCESNELINQEKQLNEKSREEMKDTLKKLETEFVGR